MGHSGISYETMQMKHKENRNLRIYVCVCARVCARVCVCVIFSPAHFASLGVYLCITLP